VTPTRTRALDAAIELLGTEGLRALTHARIDERAGIPRGSTSNYFRTRAALLSGVMDGMLEREMADYPTLPAPTTADELVDWLVVLLEHATVRNRTLTTARLVMFMEASHDPELRETLSKGRAAMESWFVPTIASLGARDAKSASDAIAACFEGLVLHRIARHDDTDPRPAFELVVRAALA
jgi:DNA-binding transcriptional regulator YbjK